MARYQIPIAKVTSGTADKCYVNITAGTNHQVEIEEVHISFDGADTVGVPIEVQLVRTSTDGSGSSAGDAATKNNDSDGDSPDFTLTKGFSTQPTKGDIVRRWFVHPQSGLLYPVINPIIIGAGDKMGLFTIAPAAAVNVVGYLLVRE